MNGVKVGHRVPKALIEVASPDADEQFFSLLKEFASVLF